MSTTTQRVYNFSAGPAVLPEPVLAEAQRDLMALPGLGMSILEISHRSRPFVEIIESAESRLRELLAIPEHYHVLFLQGGSRLQFSMVAQNLLRGTGRAADYIISGSWGKKAIEEARREGDVRVAWDGKPTNYDRLPSAAEMQLDANAAYVHFTSNETIQGVQFDQEPEVGGVPLVCDASSDFLSRPLPIERYGLIYACAQKNVGPAGVTVVILREDLLERSSDELAGMLDYRNHVRDRSLYNTPPTFAVYMVNLVARWLQEEIGGLAAMRDRNRRKAKLLYDQIDQSEGFYTGHVRREDRSQMNVTFRLPDEATTDEFLREAREHELESLEGHRSVGGIRASVYNAMPEEGVQRLATFMREFREARAG